MFVVFDLDNTLAMGAHRQHHLDKTPQDWEAWHLECLFDTPCAATVRTLLAHVRAGHRVEIWTGRSDSTRPATNRWLTCCLGPAAPDFLTRMRAVGDHVADFELKRRWLRAARANGGGPDLAYDDRDRVVAMWREEGVTCYQVRPGAY